MYSQASDEVSSGATGALGIVTPERRRRPQTAPYRPSTLATTTEDELWQRLHTEAAALGREGRCSRRDRGRRHTSAARAA